MGTLLGHALNGTLLMLIGTWWTYSALRRYFLCKQLQHPLYKYRNTVTYPFPCVSPQAPVEAWLKFGWALIGGTGEFFGGVAAGPGLVPGWALQHIMVQSFFLVSGVTDLIMHYYPRVLPKFMDHLALSFTSYMKYRIFADHMHGKGILENTMHGFLLPLDQAVAIALLLEIFCNESVIPALLRGVITFIAGSWLVQIGFTLFPPSGIIPYDENDHTHLNFLSGIYTLHYLGGIVYLYALVFLTKRRVRHQVACFGMNPNLSSLDYIVEGTEFEPDTKFR